MSQRRRTEVLYIAAAPRSGTTIVSSLLGEAPGVFNAGEVRFLWKQLAGAGTCGCRQPLDECAVWSRALAAAAGGAPNGDAAVLMRGGAAHSLIRTLPAVHARRRLIGDLSRSVRGHLERTLPVYAEVATTADARLVVDSSKSPSYAYLLAQSPDIALHLVHVLRDPRAVVYSWLRERGDALNPALRLRAVAYHASKWSAWNVFIERQVSQSSASYTRLVYDDFASAPHARLSAILHSHGVDASDLPVSHGDAPVATLSTNHTVDGNGYRFWTGAVPIRIDDEWRTRMLQHERLIVQALTWPLIERYGLSRSVCSAAR